MEAGLGGGQEQASAVVKEVANGTGHSEFWAVEQLCVLYKNDDSATENEGSSMIFQ